MFICFGNCLYEFAVPKHQNLEFLMIKDKISDHETSGCLTSLRLHPPRAVDRASLQPGAVLWGRILESSPKNPDVLRVRLLVRGCIPTPLKKIRVRQLGWAEIPNIWEHVQKWQANHQPAVNMIYLAIWHGYGKQGPFLDVLPIIATDTDLEPVLENLT